YVDVSVFVTPPCSLFFSLLSLRPPRPTLFPYTTLFRSILWSSRPTSSSCWGSGIGRPVGRRTSAPTIFSRAGTWAGLRSGRENRDRKSTRLNSSHQIISYAVFCLKKKTKKRH